MPINTPRPAAALPGSPWGPVRGSRLIAPGVVEVCTASHGGIWLDPTHQALVPAPLRTSDGWYEEDCEAHVVAATFPALFAACYLVAAHQALACWHPAAYAAAWPVENRPTRRTERAEHRDRQAQVR